MKDFAQELLSVDTDAHLQKLAAHIFPSPALLPVELVRCALKRRAAAVSIQLHAKQIEISDNGDGISSIEWQALACAADSRQNDQSREKAMACIQNLAGTGIGMLAVFFPGARSLQIENSGPAGKNTLRMTNGQIELQNTCNWPQGTRIVIARGRGPVAKENKLLSELCVAVQAEIVINGRRLQKKPLLTNTMASINFMPGEKSSCSLVAVPARGDVCRIWLLDQGIPWQVTAMAPIRGLVFAAALETANQLAPSTLETLAATANRLYQWLAENYAQFSEPYQSRIDDLFFKQARLGEDPGWLSLCAPFRLWHSAKRVNLTEVRLLAEKGVLYFMDYSRQLKQLYGREKDLLSCTDRPISSATIGGRSVLLLTPLQKDFLLNFLGLPIVSLSFSMKTIITPYKILAFWWHKFAGRKRLLALQKNESLDSCHLSQAENTLCLELEKHWRRKLASSIPAGKAFNLTVVIAEGRGLVPACWLKNERGDILQIRRRHPLTLRALHSISQNRDNSELAFAALMPDYFLTGTN